MLDGISVVFPSVGNLRGGSFSFSPEPKGLKLLIFYSCVLVTHRRPAMDALFWPQHVLPYWLGESNYFVILFYSNNSNHLLLRGKRSGTLSFLCTNSCSKTHLF